MANETEKISSKEKEQNNFQLTLFFDELKQQKRVKSISKCNFKTSLWCYWNSFIWNCVALNSFDLSEMVGERHGYSLTQPETLLRAQFNSVIPHKKLFTLFISFKWHT